MGLWDPRAVDPEGNDELLLDPDTEGLAVADTDADPLLLLLVVMEELREADLEAATVAEVEGLNDVDLLPEPDTEDDRLGAHDGLPETVCRRLYEPPPLLPVATSVTRLLALPPPLLPDAEAVLRSLLLIRADTELLADTLVLAVSKAEREGDLLTEELAVAVGTPSLIDKTTPLPTLLPSLINWSIRLDDATVISLPMDPSQAAAVLPAASLT